MNLKSFRGAYYTEIPFSNQIHPPGLPSRESSPAFPLRGGREGEAGLETISLPKEETADPDEKPGVLSRNPLFKQINSTGFTRWISIAAILRDSTDENCPAINGR